MASIQDIRSQGESNLAKTMRGLSKKHKQRIKNAMKQYGGFENIPNAFWEELQKDIRDEMMAMFILIYVASHETTQNKMKFQIPQEELQIRAQTVAGNRASLLATSYVGHTRERMQNHLDNIRSQITSVADEVREMTRKADEVLSAERAESVAVTETTASISAGQLDGVDDYKVQNPTAITDVLWITEADGKVCTVCRPLHRKKEEVWSTAFPAGPPAHPNCRCELKTIGKQSKTGRLPELQRGQGRDEPISPGLRYGG